MNIERAKQLQILGPKGTIIYGGDQDWYSSNTRAQGGCSSVAGANVLRALARLDSKLSERIRQNEKIAPQLVEALCEDKPTKDCFGILMTGVYNKMHTFEIPILNRLYDKKERGYKPFKIIRPNQGQTNTGFIIGVIRFARKFGIDIKVNYLNTAFVSADEGRGFIEEGLEKSGAVVIMTSYNTHGLKLYNGNSDLSKELKNGYDAKMKCHFATITDIDGDRLLITTWGRPAVGDFKEISKSWRSIKAFESTLMYIELSDKKEANRCMLGSFKAFLGGIVQTITLGKCRLYKI